MCTGCFGLPFCLSPRAPSAQARVANDPQTLRGFWGMVLWTQDSKINIKRLLAFLIQLSLRFKEHDFPTSKARHLDILPPPPQRTWLEWRVFKGWRTTPKVKLMARWCFEWGAPVQPVPLNGDMQVAIDGADNIQGNYVIVNRSPFPS